MSHADGPAQGNEASEKRRSGPGGWAHPARTRHPQRLRIEARWRAPAPGSRRPRLDEPAEVRLSLRHSVALERCRDKPGVRTAVLKFTTMEAQDVCFQLYPLTRRWEGRRENGLALLTHVQWHRLAMRPREALHPNPQQTGAHRVCAVRLRARSKGARLRGSSGQHTCVALRHPWHGCPLHGDCQVWSYEAACVPRSM
jgi:hypothetical protein